MEPRAAGAGADLDVLHRLEVHRLEEDDNLGDNVIVLAISARQGIKGILLDGYGAYAGALTWEMAQKLRDARKP